MSTTCSRSYGSRSASEGLPTSPLHYQPFDGFVKGPVRIDTRAVGSYTPADKPIGRLIYQSSAEGEPDGSVPALSDLRRVAGRGPSANAWPHDHRDRHRQLVRPHWRLVLSA